MEDPNFDIKEMPNLPAFPLLAGTLALKTESGRGTCFHRACALVLDLPSVDLCVGTLRGVDETDTEEVRARPEYSPTPFIHCWVERGEELFAPSTIEAAGGNLLGFPKDLYYHHNGVRDVYRINRAEVKRLAVKHGWLKALPFGNGAKIDAPLGKTLLEAMGVPYEVSGRGGVVPVGYGDRA